MRKLAPRGEALGWLAASLMLASAPGAVAAPMPYLGGDIDGDRIEEGEIYLEEPKPAAVPRGCEVAQKYIDVQNAGRHDKVAELFTPDAIFLHGNGPPAVGHEGINRYYTTRIKSVSVKLVPVAYVATPGVCLVQLAIGRLGSGKPQFFSASIDQFFVAPDGRSTMMMPYGRRNRATQGTIDALRKQETK